MIDVTLLGTSALVPLPERALTAAVLHCAGHSILIDCGEGTQTSARRHDTGALTADVIALTHYHGDHIFGLPGLIQTMTTMNRTAPLTIIGPAPIMQELAPIMQLIGWTSYEIRLMELPTEGIALCELHHGWPAGARLTPIPTDHRVASQAYAFTLDRAGKFDAAKAQALELPKTLWSQLQEGQPVQHNGRLIEPQEVLGAPRRGLKVVMSGDTKPCDALLQATQDADLLISEATYGDNDHAPLANEYGHMTFAQAAQLAAKAHVKRLWLTHFSQRMACVEDYLPNAQAYYPEAVCGVDGMKIKLKFTE